MRIDYELELDSSRSGVSFRWSVGDRVVFSPGAIIAAMVGAAGDTTGHALLLRFQLYDDLELVEGADGILVAVDQPSRIEMRSRNSAITGRRWSLQASALRGSPSQQGYACLSHRRESEATLIPVDLYSKLEKLGIAPDLSLRRLADVVSGRELLSARVLKLPGRNDASIETAVAVDCGLQLACLLATQADVAARHLVGIERIMLRPAAGRPLFARAVRSALEIEGRRWDVQVGAPGETPVVELRGIEFASLTKRETDRVSAYAARIAEKVREVHGLTLNSVDDNLVLAGLTSMATARLLAALSDEWGWAPSLGRFAASSTCREIARAYAVAAEGAWCGSAEVTANPDAKVLSSSERRLWYLEQVANAAPAYNEAMAWTIRGALDLTALQRALNAIVARHEALHTSFPVSGGKPCRRVHEQFLLPLRIVEVPHPSDVRAALATEVRRRFALESEPPIRASLLRTDGAHCVLVIVAHHVICDAESTWVFRQQLAAAYAACVHGRDPELRESKPMSHHARSEAEYAGGGEPGALLDWWQRELDGVPDFLDLPIDSVRPAVQSHTGERMRFTCGREAAERLRGLSQRIGVTPFALCLAAFQILLHRYSRQASFVVAVPMSVRSLDFSETIGCLINTLPVRADFRDGCTLLEAARQTSTTIDRTLGRRAAPFDAVVGRLRRERSLSHTPLAQVSFSYIEPPARDLVLEGLGVEGMVCESGTAKFELSLIVECDRAELNCAFEYNNALFRAWRVQQMAEHFRRILERLASDPNALVDGRWLLTAEDEARLRAFGRGSAEPVRDWDVRALIDRQAREAPDRIAVVDGEGAFSYGQLERDVARLAGSIVSELGESDRVVAIEATRNYRWVVGVLAVLRSGRVYLPIDAAVPEARAQLLLRQSGAGLLLFQAADRRAGYIPVPVARSLDVERALEAETQPLTQRIAAGPEQPFYAIATSGSTGAPKLAMASYLGVANLVQWYGDAAALDEFARVVIATSPGFDLTQKNLLAGLAHGATLILHPDQVFDPRCLAETIARERASHLNCTPSMLQALLEVCALTGYRELESLEQVVLGGEVPSSASLLSWLRHPACRARLMNSYGPSECTDVCVAGVLDVEQLERGFAPIGHPIPNVQLAVVDENGSPVPIGVSGELIIGGTAFASALANDRQQASLRSEELAGCYASGDFVHYLSDGRLVFEGRRDEALKLRGYRISPYEIETRLTAHPGVAEAAVVVRPIAEGSAVLCAYHAPAPGPSAEALRQWLASVLPQYMVPSIFVPMDRLPLNRSGKIDRNALPTPMPTAGAAGRRPDNAMEELLLGVWRSALHAPELSVEHDFFLAGGHSLLAVKVAAEVERATAVCCRPADIVANASVERLARLIASRQAGHARAVDGQPKPGA